MNNDLTLFFNEIKKIQSDSVNTMLCNLEDYKKTEDMLKDFSYDIIYRIMELLDGCIGSEQKYIIINKENRIINSTSNLHDLCETFLFYK